MAYKRPALSALTIGHTTTNYNDSTDYFFGTNYSPALPVANKKIQYFPKDGRVTGVNLNINYAGAPTNEDLSLYIRINDTTDYLIGTVATGTTNTFFVNLALNISVKTTDFFEMKLVTPAWVTNPSAASCGGTILIEVP